MTAELHLHFHLPPGAEFSPIIISQLRKILMDNAALAQALTGLSADLNEVATTLDKAADEITVALSNAGVTSPEVDALVAQLQGQAQNLKSKAGTLDGFVPDQPVTP